MVCLCSTSIGRFRKNSSKNNPSSQKNSKPSPKDKTSNLPTPKRPFSLLSSLVTEKILNCLEIPSPISPSTAKPKRDIWCSSLWKPTRKVLPRKQRSSLTNSANTLSWWVLVTMLWESMSKRARHQTSHGASSILKKINSKKLMLILTVSSSQWSMLIHGFLRSIWLRSMRGLKIILIDP